jgi:phenylacetate-CoA ligase
MPLVRFDIGDIAEFAPREPAQHHAFATLHGRDNTHFLAPSGRRIHGEYFTHLFYGRDWLETFQVAQTAPDRVEIRYVPAGDRRPSADQLEDIRKKIAAVLGSGTHVSFAARSHIERLGSGKFQFVRREFA